MTIRIKRLLPSLAKRWGYILIALITAGCEWGDRTITLVRPNTDNLQVIYTDTVTVFRSTVMKDSLNTTSGSILAGSFEDDLLGLIQARGYLSATTSGAIGLQDRAVYDSLAMTTKIVYSYGDTTQRYTLSVHELKADITRGPYYNIRGSEYDEDPLGVVSFVPKPKLNDSLRVRLADELGQRLFKEARANNLNNQESLLKHFKGLTFTGGYTNNTGFLGFEKDNTLLTLYYHVDGPDGKVRYTINIQVGQFYNQIVNDRSGTDFEDLVTARNGISSDITEGVTVIQSGVGLMTRLDFPYLHQFGFDLGKVVVNRAFLRIDLPRNPEVPYMPPPARIALYATNVNNDWDFNSSEVVAGAFVDDDVVNPNARYYNLDVSSMITQLVQSKVPSPVGFLVGPLGPAVSGGGGSSYSTSLDRLILPKGSVKLLVYYTTLVE